MSSVVLDSLYSAALETIIMSFAKGHTWAPHSGLCCEDKDSYLGYLGITQETVNEVYTLGFSGPENLSRIFLRGGGHGHVHMSSDLTNFWS